MRLLSPSNQLISFTNEPCANKNDKNCIVVIPKPNALQVDTQYRLHVPAGSMTFEFGGPTRKELFVECAASSN